MSDVVVLGASLAGLFAAAAAAGTGARVLVLDGDEVPQDAIVRAGVPQGAHIHVLLHRAMRAGEELLPGVRDDLMAAGAVAVDTGLLPWLGEHGWLPTRSSYDVVSLTRPLLEQVVRDRVLDLPGVDVRWGTRVQGLDPQGAGWRVRVAQAADVTAPLVVDATGRSSRLRRWLTELGVDIPEPLVVDARLGYATQLVAGGPDPRDLPGVVVQATPESPVGGIALPVEGRRWLVGAVGFGDNRPPRDAEAFAAFVSALPDRALSALLRSGEPVGEVAVYRQTANRRHRYAATPGWPGGLLVVGDALCCFDPVYGQGIAVSALQALRLRAGLNAGLSAGRLLRELDRVTEFPWAVAIGQDLRMPSSSGRQSRLQALTSAWVSALERRAVLGDERASATLAGVYHLERSPSALLHPALIASVALGRVRREQAPAPRPAVLDRLLP